MKKKINVVNLFIAAIIVFSFAFGITMKSVKARSVRNWHENARHHMAEVEKVVVTRPQVESESIMITNGEMFLSETVYKSVAVVVNVSTDAVDLGLNMEAEHGSEDYRDLIDVSKTYNAISEIMGREPDIRELLYMTIWSEYWLISHSTVGQEAVARSYYHFCGTDGCTDEELIRFLSGYQPWFRRPNLVDVDPVKAAEHLYMMFSHEYNYQLSGEKLYAQIDEILDVEFAEKAGWTRGKEYGRPSQWYGPSGPPPDGASIGMGNNNYAITKINYLGMKGQFFYFLTYDQELKFRPTQIE